MSVLKADEYRHNNPNRSFVDADFVRGGGRVVADRAALYALASKADQLKEGVTQVRVRSENQTLLLLDITQVGAAAGWGPVGGAAAVLYKTLGQNTDGALDQKTATDALNGKAALNHTHPASQITDFATAADARIAVQKGQPGGLAPLGANKLVPSEYLPAAVDEIQEYVNLAAFPATGSDQVIYVALDQNKQYRWSGTQYTPIVNSGGVEAFNGRKGNVTLAQADVDPFLSGVKARVTENEGDISALETTVTRIDNEVDTLQAVVPANASPTNQLVTASDLGAPYTDQDALGAVTPYLGVQFRKEMALPNNAALSLPIEFSQAVRLLSNGAGPFNYTINLPTSQDGVLFVVRHLETATQPGRVTWQGATVDGLGSTTFQPGEWRQIVLFPYASGYVTQLRGGLPAAASAGGLAAASIPIQTAQTNGAQSFDLPASTSFLLGLLVLEGGPRGGGVRSIWPAHWSVSGTTVTVTADGEIETGDQITGTCLIGTPTTSPTTGGGTSSSYIEPDYVESGYVE